MKHIWKMNMWNVTYPFMFDDGDVKYILFSCYNSYGENMYFNI